MYTKYLVVDYYDGYNPRWFYDYESLGTYDSLEEAINKRNYLLGTDDYIPENIHIQEVKWVNPHPLDIEEFI